MIEETYSIGVFDHRAVAPLIQAGPNAWIMELFRGPTLSFKDYALQLLGRLFDYVLEKRGERMTIVGATSGDTGSAAIEACRNCRNIDIFILHPHNRTSDVQRRQMTTVDTDNVHNIALSGTFDDCQAIVKELFSDTALRDRLNLSAVNSINWARIMAQTVYYVTASLALGGPDRRVSFTVPTGNFGNVYAAWVAAQMGLPVGRLVRGTNRNDILTRFFETGRMETGTVEPSLSPSMDIQVSSNFERYLCALTGRDHAGLTAMMEQFRNEKRFAVAPNLLTKAQETFTAARCNDEQTLETIARTYAGTGVLIDPHTAVAMHCAAKTMEADPSVPMVVLACAHPAKFPEAVKKATGRTPPVPERLAAVMDKKERFTVLENDTSKIKDFVLAHTRT
jgi:threonine synthase